VEPGLQGRVRGALRQQGVGRGGQLLDLALIDRRQQGVAGREVAVQRADADLSPSRDLFQRHIRADLRERRLGGRQQVFAIAQAVDAWLAALFFLDAQHGSLKNGGSLRI
jgi:hypothetical protein